MFLHEFGGREWFRRCEFGGKWRGKGVFVVLSGWFSGTSLLKIKYPRKNLIYEQHIGNILDIGMGNI